MARKFSALASTRTQRAAQERLARSELEGDAQRTTARCVALEQPGSLWAEVAFAYHRDDDEGPTARPLSSRRIFPARGSLLRNDDSRARRGAGPQPAAIRAPRLAGERRLAAQHRSLHLAD